MIVASQEMLDDAVKRVTEKYLENNPSWDDIQHALRIAFDMGWDAYHHTVE